jgi:putative tryptophan/tyrosine transport system substrate-binding protein
MRRRELIALLGGAAAWPLGARAQRGDRVRRIGVVSPGGPSITWMREGLRQGLNELGYVEGENLRIDFRWAHGRFERLPALVSELLDLNVEVVVAQATQAAIAAKDATSTVPIVMMGVADPIGVGLARSLARPGGNVTGTSNVAAEIVGKQLQILRDVGTNTSRVAVLWNPANHAFQMLQLREAEAAARASGVQLQVLAASAPDDFDAAFAAMRNEGTRALLVLVDPLFSLHREALIRRVVDGRIPAVSGVREFAEAGGLLAYGASYFDAAKRAAVYVDRILKGAKPSDLPIEQSTKFELIINMRAAKGVGIEIPPTLLARADEVIE